MMNDCWNRWTSWSNNRGSSWLWSYELIGGFNPETTNQLTAVQTAQRRLMKVKGKGSQSTIINFWFENYWLKTHKLISYLPQNLQLVVVGWLVNPSFRNHWFGTPWFHGVFQPIPGIFERNHRFHRGGVSNRSLLRVYWKLGTRPSVSFPLPECTCPTNLATDEYIYNLMASH